MATPIRSSEKIGFDTKEVRSIVRTVYPFFHCSAKLPKDLLTCTEPLIFCCNHYQFFGPVAAVISLPLRFHVWMNRDMLSALSDMDSLVRLARETFPFLSVRQATHLLKKLTPQAETALQAIEPIWAGFDQPFQTARAVRESIACLTRGEHLIIFPETGLPTYPDGGISPLFSGFTLVGEMYRRETGKTSLFVPIYIDRWKKKLLFGRPIAYPDQPAAEAGETVRNALTAQLLDMAELSGHLS